MKGRPLHRIWRAYGEGGVRLVVRKLVSRVRCVVILYEFDLERDLPSVASEVPLEVRALSVSEVAAYVALRADEDAGEVLARLGQGDVCFVSWAGERIVGCAWVRSDCMWVSEIGKSFPLQAGEVYGYDSYTDPGHRGRGAASVRAQELLRYVKSLGFRRLVAYVMSENIAGRAALDTLGFACGGSTRWLHVGDYGLELTSGQARRPRLGVHIRPRSPHERVEARASTSLRPRSRRRRCG